MKKSLRFANRALLLAAGFLAPRAGQASHAHLNYPDWWKPGYETEVIHAPAPARAADRLREFEERDSEERVRQLAEAFFARIDLDQVKIASDRLRLDSWGRNETRWSERPKAAPGIKELLGQKKYREALDAYRDFFFHRLLNPPPGYPIVPEHPEKRIFIEFIHQPDELLKENVARFTMLDAKGEGAVVRLDMGAPGQVNWTYVPENFRPYDDLIFPPGVNFMVACTKQPYFYDTLLRAYMESGDKAYLKKWAAFHEDRMLNFTADADAALTSPPVSGAASSVSAGGGPAVGTLAMMLRVFGHLGYVLQHRPELAKDFPSTTLARMILDLWKGGPIGLRATRASSNNRSIDMYSEPFFLAGLAFPEFAPARYYIRERIRTVELFPTVTMMPDGSDIENEVGYNRVYLLSAARTRDTLLKLPSIRPPEVNAKWFADLEDNFARRLKFLLFMKINNGWTLYPSYYRVTNDFTGPDPLGLSASPRALLDPVMQPVIAKLFGGEDGQGAEPAFRSVSWPYAGNYLIRSGWDKDAQQLYMQSPRPYSTATWKNANDIQLFAFGQPLLTYHTEGYGYVRRGYKGDGVVSEWEEGFRRHLVEKYKNPEMHGLYQWEFTPVFVDECPQIGDEAYKALPESVRNDPTPMYGRGTAMAYQTPLQNRWHESPRFTFCEGEYSGPFAKVDASRVINGVSHRRQILFCREAGVWLVWDRLNGDAPHHYRVEWKFAQPFESSQRQQIPGFAPGDIRAEEQGRTLRTAKKGTANLTIAMQSASPLEPVGTSVVFKGSGTVLSLLYPRRTIDTDLSKVTRWEGGRGQTGLEALTPEGYRVEVRTAASGKGAPATLELDGKKINAESLVIVTDPAGRKSGIVLGSQSGKWGDTALSEQVRDFEFAEDSDKKDGAGNVAILPIHRPLERPAIEPAANCFIDEATVRITHTVPGVELRYTLDGTEPTLASPLYEKPLALRATTTVRARAFRPGVTEMPPTSSGTLVSETLEAVYTRRKPVAAAPEPEDAQPGLSFAYYKGDASTGAEEPAGIAPEKSGVVKELLDAPIRGKKQSDLYVYRGYLKVPEDGVYSIHAPSEFVTPGIDAGYDLRLWLDKQEWQPATGWHNYATWSVPLKKGLHPIKVIYVDWRRSGMTSFGVPWRGEHPVLKISELGGKPRPVPAGWLYH